MLPAGGRAVVVGASLAGVRAAETLRREGFTGELTIVGAEEHWPPYDRPPLSKRVLAGAIDAERTRLRIGGELDDAHVLLGRRAASLDREKQQLVLDDGRRLPYDGLVIATGAHPRTLPSGEGVAGVFTLRTHDDCRALIHALVSAQSVAVVGAGFIGSEVASTCRDLEKRVTVIEALAQPLLRVLGDEMGRFAASLQRDRGVDLRLNAAVKAFASDDDGRVAGLALTDGSTVHADVVVVGIGVIPTVAWLDGSGVALDDGVVCDEHCRAVVGDGSSIDPSIVAAGDVARWLHPRIGRRIRVEHWTNAVEQSAHAARVLLRGEEAGAFEPVPYFWSDQFGAKLQFVGVAPPGSEPTIVEGDLESGRFAAGYGEGGRLAGVLCVNMPHRVVPWQRRIAAGDVHPPGDGDLPLPS